MRRHELTDEQFNNIERLLPGRKESVGVTAKDNRAFINGVSWIFKTGAPWRGLPERYGHWKNVHRRFSRWAQKGVFDCIFRVLSLYPDMEFLLMDGTIVKAHQHSAGAKKNKVDDDESIGRSRGGLSTKIHWAVDGLGNPIDFILTGGQVHDSQCAEALLDGKDAGFVIADKAFDNEKILKKIESMGALAVIPPTANRKVQREYDKHYYKERHLVERFFCKLKQFRGIATRYCKRGKYFLEAVKLASSVILMC